MKTQQFELPIIGDPDDQIYTVQTGTIDGNGKPVLAVLNEKYAIHTRQRCTHGHEYHANSHEYPCPYCTITKLTKLEQEKKQSENDITNIRAKVQRLERDLQRCAQRARIPQIQQLNNTTPAHQVAQEILEERKRQHTDEGWSIQHDDKHTHGELGLAAAVYAANCNLRKQVRIKTGPGFCEGKNKWIEAWPWDNDWDKRRKHPRRRQLIISAALIIAEIERLDRLEEKKKAAQPPPSETLFQGKFQPPPMR